MIESAIICTVFFLHECMYSLKYSDFGGDLSKETFNEAFLDILIFSHTILHEVRLNINL